MYVAIALAVGAVIAFVLYKHRQKIKLEAAAEAYRLKELAKREGERVYSGVKNRL